MKNTDMRLTDEELIEELKKRFSENKKSLVQLEKLTSELKNVNKKLSESEALKTHFISNITNEIVNPFASILGLSKNILLVKKDNWERVYSMARLIHSEAFCLNFQLKNIFSAAEIEAGELYPQSINVDIALLVKNTLEQFSPEASRKELKIEYINELKREDRACCFRTDHEKLQLIVNNLLSNAIKYSNQKGEIIIKTLLENNNLKIVVQDFGIGILPENQEIIFDRFKRLDTGINSINRGHGLGLSVIKAFLELLNGSISVESELEDGAIFTIMLPETIDSIDVDGFASDGNEIFFDDNDLFDNEIF